MSLGPGSAPARCLTLSPPCASLGPGLPDTPLRGGPIWIFRGAAHPSLEQNCGQISESQCVPWGRGRGKMLASADFPRLWQEAYRHVPLWGSQCPLSSSHVLCPVPLLSSSPCCASPDTGSHLQTQQAVISLPKPQFPFLSSLGASLRTSCPTVSHEFGLAASKRGASLAAKAR